MKPLKWLASSTALALVLTACSPSQTPAPETEAVSDSAQTGRADVDAYLAFAGEDYAETGASEADLSALQAALPAPWALSWSDKMFDPDSGATVFTDLALTVEGDHPFGVSFGSAGVWGLDTSLLEARLQGERLDESGALFTRFKGDEMVYFGVVDAANGFIESVVAGLPDGESFDPDYLRLDTFEGTVGQMIMSDVSLRPWEYAPMDEALLEDLEAEEKALLLPALRFGQQAIAVTRSLAYEEAVAIDTDTSFSFVQPGAEITGRSTIDLYGASGIAGFDLDQTVAMDMKSNQYTLYTDLPGTAESEFGDFAANPFAGSAFDQSTLLDYSSVSNLKLDKVMGFLARGEVPAMTERDLMSLGTWVAEGYSASLDEEGIVSAARLDVDLSEWEWLIPTKITYALDDASVEVANITEFVSALIPSELAAEDEETALMLEGIDKAIELLPEHGLDTIGFDASGDLRWSQDTGATSFFFDVQSPGNGDRLFELSIDLPNYDDMLSLTETDDPEIAFEEAFETSFAFKGLRLKEVDAGGYDKIFSFAQAIGQEYPEEGWGAMVGAMTPEQMRMNIATMIRFWKTEVEAEFPAAAEWVETFATYIQESGALELSIAPPVPVTVAMLDALDDTGPNEIEQALLDMFNVSVTHTPN